MRTVEAVAVNQWVEAEFAGANLGDKRLNARIATLMSAIVNKPLATLAASLRHRSCIKAAYRFFGNKKVSKEKIFEPHVTQTAARAHEAKVVLCIQDTTSLNYSSHHATEGLGHVGSARVRKPATGLYVHSALVVNACGTPLGLLDQHIWARTDVHQESDNKRKVRLRKTDITQKESHRWVKTMEHCRSLLSRQTEVISVCDRESDIYEFLKRSTEVGSSFIVRAKSERKISESEEDDQIFLLSEAFIDLSPIAKTTVNICGNSQREGRQTEVLIYARHVTIQPPERQYKQDPLTLTALHVVESRPTKGKERISWLLLTDLDISNEQSATKAVYWYSLRWRIEEFHKVLKSGYQMEDCRLGTASSLMKMAACKSIAAFRICQLTYLHRQDPTVSALDALSEAEWKCAFLKLHLGKKLPKRPPQLKEAIEWIARLGGYNGGKNQNPGIVTIWRGWHALTESIDAWRSLSAAGLATYGH
jgi:hypothetical protein